ncbi:MAG TPA: hypothetical protein VHS76_15500 [Steroidobacteraceae bacterium]|jgi:hypothetical protein|nr:hypothetical protein [Steroidobacteraceae bacterium]
MPDAFVYYFLVLDRSTGKLVSSKRRATLAAIKSTGEPLMESEMAVDASEVDAAGFLVGRSIGGSDPSDELWGEIRSLKLRAESREREARQLIGIHRERKLILGAESRELRGRAERLQQLIQASDQHAFMQAFQRPVHAEESSTQSDFFEER